MEWLESNQLKVELPKKCKKITGTRFASILGKNVWNTPFKTWCEITKAYEEPFKETIYTLAGKSIEHKQINYLKKAYFMTGIKTPTDVFGKDFFSKTYGDFFKDEPIFGGMWDALNYENDKPCMVIECKTTKRAEDWEEDIPEYYSLQASLYGYLKGIDDICMIVSFLDDKTYLEAQKFMSKYNAEKRAEMIETGEVDEHITFTPNAQNTAVRTFKISEKYPNFTDLINTGRKWWESHIVTGISPIFDETADADVLINLRKNHLNPTTDIDEILKEADALQTEINEVVSTVADKQKRLETVLDQLKEYMTGQFRDGDSKVSLTSSKYEYVLSKTQTSKIDKKKLEKDGLLSRYETITQSTRLTKKDLT